MIVYVLDGKCGVQHMFDVAPRCGEDFCDGCGDCLDCYAGDPCPEGSHRRIVYADQAADWHTEHPNAEQVDHLIPPAQRSGVAAQEQDRTEEPK